MSAPEPADYEENKDMHWSVSEVHPPWFRESSLFWLLRCKVVQAYLDTRLSLHM